VESLQRFANYVCRSAPRAHQMELRFADPGQAAALAALAKASLAGNTHTAAATAATAASSSSTPLPASAHPRTSFSVLPWRLPAGLPRVGAGTLGAAAVVVVVALAAAARLRRRGGDALQAEQEAEQAAEQEALRLELPVRAAAAAAAVRAVPRALRAAAASVAALVVRLTNSRFVKKSRHTTPLRVRQSAKDPLRIRHFP
jgi:hypothetical protein